MDKMKRKKKRMGENLTNNMTDKELISKICKKLIHFNIKKQIILKMVRRPE